VISDPGWNSGKASSRREEVWMPRYAAFIYVPTEFQSPASPELFARVLEEYSEFGTAATEAGVLRVGEALAPLDSAVTVLRAGGRSGPVVLRTGPFAQTDLVLDGFYLLECENDDEAAEWASRIPGAWYGRVEVRPCVDVESETVPGSSS
jgi:hypothetical protein